MQQNEHNALKTTLYHCVQVTTINIFYIICFKFSYSLRSGKPLLDRELNRLGREDSVPRLLDLFCIEQMVEEIVPATTE